MTCPPVPLERDPQYLREIWTLSASGMSILITRLLVRLRTIGLGQFKWDDWLVVPIIVLSAMTNTLGMIVHNNGAVAMFTPDQLLAMEPCQIATIESGFKALFAVWYTVTALTWGFKCMMLLFLHRVMRNLEYNVWLNIVVVTTIFSYLAVVGSISLTCRPASEYWRILPPQGLDACRYSRATFWSATIGNLLTDLMMICLPIPIILRMRAPLSKRLLLALPLSTGILATTAVVIRLVFTLRNMSVTESMQWGARELLALNCAVNLPFLKPLITKRFWKTESGFCGKMWQKTRPEGPTDPPMRIGILPSLMPVSWGPQTERCGGGISVLWPAGSWAQHESNISHCHERVHGKTDVDDLESGKTIVPEKVAEEKKQH